MFTREWRYLEEAYREQILAERRRYEERWRALFREGVESGGLRTDLDVGAATLLVLSAANWAYTWLTPERGHRRARGPVHRDRRRRHPRLLDAVVSGAAPHRQPVGVGRRRGPAGRGARSAAQGTELRLTTRRGEATELARDVAGRLDALYVFGGDGTYNEVLNGIDADTPLGFLPGGGASVLPRALGLAP